MAKKKQKPSHVWGVEKIRHGKWTILCGDTRATKVSAEAHRVWLIEVSWPLEYTRVTRFDANR